MKRHILTLSAGLLLGLGTGALAQESEITYEEAVQKCAEFANDPQLVTIEFKVGCFDESLEWRQTGSTSLSHEQGGVRGHNIIMKEKWFTPDFAIPIVNDPKNVDCPVLTQFATSRQTSIVLSCNELVEKYQDPVALADRCSEALVEASPQTQPTGKEVNVCGETR